jgi:hypothetical protein
LPWIASYPTSPTLQVCLYLATDKIAKTTWLEWQRSVVRPTVPPSSADCPAATMKSAGTQCAAATDVCANAAVCNGSSATCPAATMKSAGTQCATATGCANAAVCDGTHSNCPTPTFKPSSCPQNASPCTDGCAPCDVFPGQCYWASAFGNDCREYWTSTSYSDPNFPTNRYRALISGTAEIWSVDPTDGNFVICIHRF